MLTLFPIEDDREGSMRVGRIVGVALGTVTALAACSSGSLQPDAGVSSSPDARFDIGIDGAQPRPGTVRMAVPAYFSPPSAQWQHLIASAPTVGMIVFNPDSGPARRPTRRTSR